MDPEHSEQGCRKVLRELFRSQRLAALATVSGGDPYLNLVAFAATDDLRHLLFATTRGTHKFQNLCALHHASMLIDNRSNQAVDFHEAVGVTALGSADETPKVSGDALLECYLAKHPCLKTFATSPTAAFFRFTVETYVIVDHFQHVVEVDVRQWT